MEAGYRRPTVRRYGSLEELTAQNQPFDPTHGS